MRFSLVDFNMYVRVCVFGDGFVIFELMMIFLFIYLYYKEIKLKKNKGH